MQPIKVLWLIKGLGPGGAEHLLVAAARSRDASEFACEVAYLLPWKDALVAAITESGVPVECYGVRNERDVRWVLRLRQRLRERPVDVVHAHSPYVAAMARLAMRTLPKRIRPAMVSTEHNAWSTFKTPTRLANAWTARFDDATIAVSSETRASMAPRQRERTEVLVHGIDVASVRAELAARAATRAEFGVGDDTVLVGTVANYHPKKDWPNLLRAARMLSDRGVAMHWLAVGQGPLQGEVEALHRALALEHMVTLTGFRPDAVRCMAGCDVFVLASQWEGLPVALMEALALGLPVVTTAVGGLAETLRDGVDALLVPPNDSAALAAAIERVVTDGALRARLATAAAARAGEFDAARAQRRLETIYRSLVTGTANAARGERP